MLSLTFVPAMIAIAITGRVQEKENRLVRGLTSALRAGAARALRCAGAGDRRRRRSFFALRVVLFLRLGQEFTPTLDEKNIVMEVKRIPSTVAVAIANACSSISNGRFRRFPQVAFVFSRTGTPDLAADPMPPNASDTYIIVKPQERMARPVSAKDELIEQIEAAVAQAAGQQIRASRSRSRCASTS